jgi:hypothetical protein
MVIGYWLLVIEIMVNGQRRRGRELKARTKWQCSMVNVQCSMFNEKKWSMFNGQWIMKKNGQCSMFNVQ